MPDVVITLRTVDQTKMPQFKQEVESLVPSLEKAGKGLTSFVTANATLIAGVVAVGAALKSSYTEFAKYSAQVRDLSIASGAGAVESSKLLQVLDDFNVSADNVTAAMRAMKDKGLSPTLKTLGELSDKFIAIQDPAEKLKFAQDNLGRSSAAFLNVLSQGSKVLDEHSAAINKNLILTDAQIEKSEKARLAVDDWNDSIEGIKVSIGAWVADMIVLNDSMAQYKELSGKAATSNGILTDGFKAYNAQIERGTAETEFYNNQLKFMSSNADEARKPLDDLSASSAQFMSVLSNVSAETESYNQKQTALFEQLQKLSDEQNKVPSWSSKYKDLGSQIDQTKKSIGQLAEEHHKASQKIIFDLVAQRAAADDYKTITLDALLSIGEQMGVLDQESVETAKGLISNANAIGDSLAYPKSQLTDMNSKVKNLQMLSQTGINIQATVTVTTIGGIPTGTVTVGGAGSGGSTSANQIVKKSWTGGQLGNSWTLVGDMPGGVPGPFSELISPRGQVYDAATTKKMLSSGDFNNYVSMAQAGDIYTGGSSSSGSAGSGSGGNSPRAPRTSTNRSGASRTSSNTSALIAASNPSTAAAAVLASNNQSVQVGESQTQTLIMTQSIQRSNNAMIDALGDLASILKDENPRAVGHAVGFELAKAS